MGSHCSSVSELLPRVSQLSLLLDDKLLTPDMYTAPVHTHDRFT